VKKKCTVTEDCCRPQLCALWSGRQPLVYGKCMLLESSGSL